MLSRYVVVPATPIETESMHEGGRYYCKTIHNGFNLYDKQDEQRLKQSFVTRIEAETECERLNSERLQAIQSSYS